LAALPNLRQFEFLAVFFLVELVGFFGEFAFELEGVGVEGEPGAEGGPKVVPYAGLPSA
jgi:hypothetical protein